MLLFTGTCAGIFYHLDLKHQTIFMLEILLVQVNYFSIFFIEVFFQYLHYLFHHTPKQFECRGLKILWILRFIWHWSHPESSSWAYQWSCRIRHYPWEICRKQVNFLCFSFWWLFFISSIHLDAFILTVTMYFYYSV